MSLTRPSRSLVWLLATSLAAVAPGAVIAQGEDPPAIPALVETAPVPGDGATGVVLWAHPDDPSLSVLIGGDENGGVGVYDLDGSELQYLAEGPLKSVDLRYGVLVGADRVDLVAVSVEDQEQVRFFRLDPATRSLVALNDISIGIPGDGVCLYDSPFTERLFVVVTSETGMVEQWQLDGEDGTIVARLARTIPVGSEVAACVADDERGQLFLSEEEVGIWRYGAEPEAGIARRLVDAGQQHLGGAGHLREQAEGLAIVAEADGAGYLVAANEKADAINIYRRDGDQAWIGTITVGEGDGVDRVTEPGGVAVLPVPLGPRFPDGVIAMSDDTNTDPDDDKSFKLASWGDALAALGLPAAVSVPDPRREIVVASRDRLPVITAVAETVPVPTGLDAADDPAVYVHPTDPALNAIVGTDKTGALVVYGFDGAIRQSLPIGRVNNVDLRDDVLVDGVPRTVVVTNNRSDNRLWVYLVDEATGTLVEGGPPIASDVNEVYGLCLYREPGAGTLYVFVNSSDTGEVEQYRLDSVTGSGLVAERVRAFVVGSQTEGCVVDDATGALYIGEELVGIWRYDADPAAGDMRVQVDSTGQDGHLVADVEGLTLLAAADGTGHLVASSQGNSTFAVYERDGDNTWLGSFRIVDGPSVDAVSGTDGIDGMRSGLPAPFEEGLLVVQDDNNREPDDNQNFKLVRWSDVVESLALE